MGRETLRLPGDSRFGSGSHRGCCGRSSMVELQPFQAGHAGSIPVARSSLMATFRFCVPCVRDSRTYPHAMFLQLNCNPRT